MDNKAVTMASTTHTVEPVAQYKRYSRSEQEYVDVSQPSVIRYYNVNLGGYTW